jgi:ribosomal protein L11
MFYSYFRKLQDIKYNLQLIKSVISLRIPAGEATSGAPLGPILGQYSIMINDFCNKFNELTIDFEPGVLLNVRILLYADLNYEMYIISVDSIYFIKYVLSIHKLNPFSKRIFVTENKRLNTIISTIVLYEIISFKYFSFYYKHITLKMLYKCTCNMLKNIGIILIPKKYIYLL